MTGLEKMKSQILDEANNSAKEIVDEANRKASAILEEARTQAASIGEGISRKSEAEIANYKDRVKSSCDLQRRKALLKAKQEVITSVLDKAYGTLKALDGAEYFNMLKKMLEKFALAQEGDIYFSSADLNRMPDGFEEEIHKIAESKGGRLTLCHEGRNIEGGFVLAYGGIEENCTFRAMFDAKKDELSDKVHELLFL